MSWAENNNWNRPEDGRGGEPRATQPTNSWGRTSWSEQSKKERGTGGERPGWGRTVWVPTETTRSANPPQIPESADRGTIGSFWGRRSWDKRQPLLPGTDKPGFIESTARIAGASLLTKALPLTGGMSWADIQQQRILNIANWFYQKAGSPDRLVLPIDQNVDAMAAWVVGQYATKLPKGVLTATALDKKVDSETRDIIRRLNQGILDNEGSSDPTDDERKLANDLIMSIGDKTPEQLKEIFDSRIFARVIDIVASREQSVFSRLHESFARSMSELRKVTQPNWLAVDWGTSAIMMRPPEREEFAATSWQLTPFALRQRRVSAIQEDLPEIPLSSIAERPSDTSPITLQKGSLDYIDLLRSNRILSPLATRIAEQGKIGGTLLLRDWNRDRAVGALAVRDSTHTKETILNLSRLARGYEDMLARMQKAVDDPEPKTGDYIRPGKVLELIPSDLIFHYDFQRGEGGKLDATHAIEGLEAEKSRLVDLLREVAQNAATRLDYKGKPQRGDQAAIDYYRDQVQATESRIDDLQQRFT